MILYQYHPEKLDGEFFLGYIHSDSELSLYKWESARGGTSSTDKGIPVFVEKIEMLKTGWRFRCGCAFSPTDEDLMTKAGMWREIDVYAPATGETFRAEEAAKKFNMSF